MGRKARPYVWRDWYVTEAGGQGIHKLCPITDGIDKAKDELERWLGRVDIHRRNCNTHNNLWSLDHFGHICSKPLYCKLLRGDCPHDLTTIH